MGLSKPNNNIPTSISWPLINNVPVITPESFGASPSVTASVNTAAIQQALNLGGYVLLATPGTYQINNTLVEGDNTFLEICPGVTITQANGTGKNMLVNSNPTGGTLGYETGGSSPSTNISGGSATTFQIAVDHDVAMQYYNSIVLTVSGLTTGALIASAMQTAIQALGGIYTSVTVTFAGGVYVITSGSYSPGPSSMVRIIAGATNNVSTTLKIGAANGAVDIDGVAGNKNIGVGGAGTWDYNQANQSPATEFLEHAIVFQSVQNVKIPKINVINSMKYCILLANCFDIRGNDLAFPGTPSDGLHFQGPCSRVDVRNIRGTCGDNIVALTCVDSVQTAISKGSFLDILIDGVYSNSTHGIGIYPNTPYIIKGLTVERTRGYVNAGNMVQVLTVATGNVYGLTLRDIKGESVGQLIDLNATINDILIEDVFSNETMNYLIDIGASAVIRHIVIDKLKSMAGSASKIICVESGATVTRMTINDLDWTGGNAGQFLNVSGTLTKLECNNIEADDGYGSYFIIIASSGAVLGTIRINNAYFKSSGNSLCVLEAYSSTTVMFDNTIFDAVTAITPNGSSVTVRALFGNVELLNSASPVYLANSGVFSANGPQFQVDVNKLTPNNGDMVYNTISGHGGGVGVNYYGGSSWTLL